MAKNQTFELENLDGAKEITYFTHAHAVDAFDLAITRAPDDDPQNVHAKVELVFFQDKGTRKREVVAAVRMELHELNSFLALIQQKRAAFLESKT